MNKLGEKILTFFNALILGVIMVFNLQVLAYSQTIGDRISTTPITITHQVNIVQAIILGFVQGATEFLPISSTAHLKAIPVALGWGDPGVSFTAVIQLGSIVAVIWYYWQDLKQITTGSIRALRKSDYQSLEFTMAVGIILGTIPIVILGIMLKIFVPDLDNSFLRSMTAIATASIIMSLLLALAESVGAHKRGFDELTSKDGILIGLAQALALIPGVSRSGSTITAGLFNNLQRATAARFSFLLGIPAITIAGLVELKEVIGSDVANVGLLALIVGVISSGIFSYLAIAWLIRYLQTKNTWVFVWYRLIFGLLIFAGVALGKFS